MENIIQKIIDIFGTTTPNEILVFLISMTPILELRGSILAAGLLKMEFASTYIISVLGNIIPIPFILLFIRHIFTLLKKTKLKIFIEKLEKKALSKSSQIQKYGKLGLFLFVAIPLPGTGAWTGSLIASLLHMRFKDSIFSITLGILTAGLIMSLLSFGIIKQII